MNRIEYYDFKYFIKKTFKLLSLDYKRLYLLISNLCCITKIYSPGLKNEIELYNI